MILNRQYVGLILIASLIAWPAARSMNGLLPIAYKCPDRIYTYIIATVALIFICFITSLFYTAKAALRNPVEALRYE
jgi:ABC-type lipoprotein release transport system permease subunit